jgi:hypothetical protein
VVTSKRIVCELSSLILGRQTERQPVIEVGESSEDGATDQLPVLTSALEGEVRVMK